MNQPKIDFDAPDELFRVQVCIRESSMYGPEAFLQKFLAGATPIAENVTALYRTWSHEKIREACTTWLTSHGLAIPEDKPRGGIFAEFLAEGRIDQEDYDEIMNRKS